MRPFTKLIVLFFLIVSWSSAKGQMKNIVLHFDTILTSKDFYIYIDFFAYTQGQKYLYPFLHGDSICKMNYAKNSLTCNLKIQSDSSTIRISLDKKGGYLELKNVYKQLGDTIKINKHKIIDIHYPDTNRTKVFYYYIINDTLGNHFKTKKLYSVDKLRRIDKVPYKTSYVINNQIYECFSTWQSDKNVTNVASFHGHGRKGLFKKRMYYFHGKTISTRTYNVITIQLKNGV